MKRMTLKQWRERERITDARSARPENQVCALARDVDEALAIWAVKTGRLCDRVAEVLGDDDDAVRGLRSAATCGDALPLACRVEIMDKRAARAAAKPADTKDQA